MKIPEPISKGRSKWGEGPVWHNGFLFHVDIHSHQVVKLDPASGEEIRWNVGEEVGFAIPCQSGRLLCGGDNGFFFLDPNSGSVTPITDPEPNLPKNRLNDGKCAPDGRLFGGSIARDKVKGAARLYRLDPDLKCSEAYGPVTNSNGLAWSADGKTLFYIDSPSKEVKAFTYDSESGALTNPKVVIDTSSEDSTPDGMCIDNDDHLWIAFCHGSHIARYNPKTGEEVERIEFPAFETTSCAFGGPNGNDLYVTTGIASGRDEEFGGFVFVIRNLPVGGPPSILFEDAS
tara:strand:+ start:1427 stop:2290 length:864 start_codon:yes stop_codon:yes gene_type:complete